jgi:hypothetical protein
MPAQAKLAAAWTSFMFLCIYVDYFHLYKPGAIDQIRGGAIFEFDISPTLMTICLAVIAIPALMVMLPMKLRSAWTWPRRTASPANLATSLDNEPLRTPQQA